MKGLGEWKGALEKAKDLVGQLSLEEKVGSSTSQLRRVLTVSRSVSQAACQQTMAASANSLP
jgi:hypothetical protein